MTATPLALCCHHLTPDPEFPLELVACVMSSKRTREEGAGGNTENKLALTLKGIRADQARSNLRKILNILFLRKKYNNFI